MGKLLRGCGVLMAVLVSLSVSAAPAAAHGRGSDATDYQSRILDAPSLPGIEWRVYGGDEFLAVTSLEHEITVLGYEQEPFLRVGPTGVFENRNSPATYLNRERFRTELPPDVRADPSASPDWVQVSSQSTALWHDHRIHWMAFTDPVLESEGPAWILDWSIPFLFDGDEHAVRGELVYVPGPAAWPWLLVAFAVSLLALSGMFTAPRGERWPGLARPAAAILGVVVLLNLSHLLDDLFAVPLPLSVIVYAALQTLLFLAVGGFGAIRGWQAGDAAFTALGVGAGAVFIGQGLLYLPALTASQLTSVFPDPVARFTIAISLVQIIAMGIVAFRGTKVLIPEEPLPVDNPVSPGNQSDLGDRSDYA